jgi:hypothetical protein
MNLTPEIKEIALDKFDSLLGNYQIPHNWFLVALAALLAALPKPKPVAWNYELNNEAFNRLIRQGFTKDIPLYTSPPDTSELEEIHKQTVTDGVAGFNALLSKYKELEVQIAIQKSIIAVDADVKNRWQEENDALLVAIEVKNAALSELEEAARCVQAGEWDRNSINPERIKAKEALALSPSAELLEARDRKRDAALLRIVLAKADWSPNQLVYANGYIDDLANQRESGEWVPELGDGDE